MILYGRRVQQIIDRDDGGTFQKEIIVTPGRVPLAIVRKRWVGRTSAGAGAAAGERGSVLLVHGFGQNRYAWHLPSRSLSAYLARAGYDVFNVDLRGHGRSRLLGAKRCRSIDDYVREDLPIAVEEVRAISGRRPVFLVGHSLGGLVSYAAAPSLAGAVAGIVSVGSPYHFTRGSLSLSAIAFFFRAFMLVGNPLRNAPLPLYPIGLTMRLMRRFAESPLYPIPLRGWHAGSCEPHILEQHLRLAFDRAGMREMMNLFEWAVEKRFGGKETDYAERFEKLDLPLLVVAGANDDLAPPPGVRAGYDRSQSRDKTYRVLPLGHIDLLVGRDAPLLTWPLVRGWIDKRAA